jgi:lysophospholipase L1-like esterase
MVPVEPVRVGVRHGIDDTEVAVGDVFAVEVGRRALRRREVSCCLAAGRQGGVELSEQGGLMFRRAWLLVGCLVVVLAAAPVGSAASPPLPSSVAAVGDSITRAADVCCWYGDHPAQSWSTGDGAFDGITSHYEHILALKPGIYGRNYNDAKSGAKMRDAAGQAQTAASQGARYVTIEMGGNDLCTSSISTMTSVADFTSQFQATMQVLADGLPQNAHVFVASIPNIYQLWQLFHDNATAAFVWSVAGICQSMLSPLKTEADRQLVVEREQPFNQALASTCGQYAFCRFDGDAVYGYPFAGGDVSKLDYFHPSLSGQAKLATITWQHSWWGS